jgi:acetyl esterase/lipase
MIPRHLLPVLLLGFSAPLLAQTPAVIPLWANGAPGFEARRNEPEVAKDYWIKNIHNPSVTVFLPPAGKANGTAMVICPGGGHRELVYQAEGVEPAQYFASLGITAFVLKYRLGREPGSPYGIETHAASDMRRAMRLVRSRAAEWGLNPGRIGVVGFSAGGELIPCVAFQPAAGDPASADPVERVSARADFLISIYPGPVGLPDKLPPDSPPAFLLCANDDDSHAKPIMKMVEQYRTLGLPVELHLYAVGGHGFKLGQNSKFSSIRHWPERMADWLQDAGYLTPVAAKAP